MEKPVAMTVQSPGRKQIITIKPKIKRKVTELRCAEVRWFHRRKDDAKWTAFKGYDSTILELAHRRKHGISLDDAAKQQMSALPENVIVLDGNYQADEDLENVDAIYWKEDSFQIRRGTWYDEFLAFKFCPKFPRFYSETMQPLQADFADAIEAHHLRNFRDNVIPETPVFSDSESSRKPELTTIKWNDEKVCWNSVVDVHITPAQKSNLVVRFLSRTKPVPLKRAYAEEADPQEGKPNFSDLILVVHGIGQKGYENLIAKNTAQIRDALEYQMEKCYPNEKRRPAILPIEWRSSLLLDNGMTDTVTLPKMPHARNTLNSVCMDLMYYQSPLYRSEIVNAVIKCLNTVYTTFMENNPGFSGPISIVGHSLGSVITYDILTNWSPFLLYDEFVTNAIVENMRNSTSQEQKQLLEQFYNSRKQLLGLGDLMEQILIRKEEPLKFKVKYLFCLGSPLAVFIIMRGADYKSVVPHSDQVERVFNIFHPYDPVAYRLEPMFHENYRHIRPLKLFSHHDATKSYENAIYECHNSYLKKCKARNKREKKAAAAGKEKKEGNGNEPKENGAGKMKNSNGGKKSSKQQQKAEKSQQKPGEEANEKQDFVDDTDSDLEIASNVYTPTDGSTPRSITPQNVAGITSTPAADVQETASTATPSTITPNSPLKDASLTVGAGTPRADDPTCDKSNALPTTEQAIEAAEEPGEEEALPAGEDGDGQLKASPLDDLKSMGEAGHLVEQIPPERRIRQRIDFQVQPRFIEKSYYSMLMSHFSYWQNLDVAAFLLNAIYPPPLEVPGVVKP